MLTDLECRNNFIKLKKRIINPIHEILKPAYWYFAFAFVGYFCIFTKLFEKFVFTVWHSYIFDFLYFYIPIVLIFEIIRRKRKLLMNIDYATTFKISAIPGAIAGFVIAYGFCSLGGCNDISDVMLSSIPFAFIVLLSGSLGLLFEYFFRRFGK